MTTRAVHEIEGHFYVSFNTRSAPSPPTRAYKPFYPEEVNRSPLWFSDTHPFMPFCNVSPLYTERIFSRLQGHRETSPVVQPEEGGRYMLDRSLAARWWRLEEALILVYTAVFAIRPDLAQPLDFKPYRLPHQWGYLKTHEDQYHARIRIWNSRNAFVPLLALCAYAVSLSQGKFLSEQRGEVNWIRTLVDKYHVCSAWANELANSWYFSPRTLRVGVYIDLESFPYSDLMDYYIVYGVPIWIRMPRNDPTHLPSYLWATRQSIRQSIMQERLQQQQQQQQQQQDDRANVPPSRTLPGESIHDFIRRTTTANERLSRTESEHDRLRRLDRERNASRFPCPGQRGAFVFEWQESGNGKIRVYVPRVDVPDIWDSYTNTQRWYNGFKDEWDLCVDLDPNAQSEANSQLDDDFPYGEDYQEPRQTLQTISLTEVEDMYPNRTIPSSSHLTTPSPNDTLFFRFGFHYDDRDYEPPQSPLSEIRVTRTLMEVSFDIKKHAIPAIHYVSYLASSQIPEIPAPLYDLHPQNLTPLRTHGCTSISCAKLANDLYQIDCESATDTELLVPHASSVVEAFRLSHCTTVQQLALHFVDQGTTFFLHKKTSTVVDPFNNITGINSGLGFRPQGFRPDWTDYEEYVRRRNDHLKDPSVVKSSLMVGGIIWRLAIDSIRENYGDVELAQFLSSDIEPAILTKRDFGIISGLYLIWTGE